jgi:glycosyltransferase involved in cell wall biosynthesis
VYVHLDHGRSPTSWRRAYDRGTVFEPSPYCYAEASAHVDLQFSHDHAEGRLHSVVRRGLKVVLGFDVWHAWRNRDRAAAADVVWTHTEREHLALAFLCRLGLLPDLRILGQSVWLWDDWARLSWPRRAAYRWMLEAVTVHTTLSPVNAGVASRSIGKPALFVPFGVVELPTAPDRPETPGNCIRVVAPGNDKHRDWPQLLEVARRAPDIEVQVLSRRRAARRLAREGLPNVGVRQASSVADILACYTDADVVVVPLHPNGHASGITVALEGLMVGRPVVVTRVGGIEDYLGEYAEYAEPGDPTSLEAAIRRASKLDSLAVREARAYLHTSGLTLSDYVGRHLELTRALLRGDCELASASRRVRVEQADVSL